MATGWVSPTTARSGASPGATGPSPRPRTRMPVLASTPRVYAVWYAVLPAPGAPPLPPLHQYPRMWDDATARAWLAVRELVRAWRQRRRVQVVFHAP